MARIEPLRALHYDPSVVGDLGRVCAPPYDVIDDAERERLLGRSPYNVVAVDLPRDSRGDPYAAAEQQWEAWQLQGAVTRDREAALWAHAQDYTGPDGQRHTRRGVFCRVRVQDYGPGRIRPHERTHPGPREDRLRLMRATRTDLSAIFSLYSDPEAAAWAALGPHCDLPPWAAVTDDLGTLHRLWRVADPQAVAAVQDAVADAELLIADGHHRYETARVYADEVGGEGAHRWVLMCLVALEDPGLEVFPTHRLVRGLTADRWASLDAAVARDFHRQPISRDELLPPAGDGPLSMGFLDGRSGQATRLVLSDQATADAALSDRSAAYRSLDTGVLEALLLRDALALDEQDISHLNGFGYARDPVQAMAMVDTGEYDAAFVMRPTPVAQVRAIAASGESMPPKSTFFFPKLLTGLVFNALW